MTILDENNKTVCEVLAKSIITSQEDIVGPVARIIATSSGISITTSNDILFVKEPKEALLKMVDSFNELFGRASFEVTKKAVYHAGVEKVDIPKYLWY